MTDPTIYRPGEGELHELPIGKFWIKATAEATEGRFYMSEAQLEPGVAGPPPHTHQNMVDMFYVLEGTLSVLAGEDWQDLPAGSFAAVPPGNVHTFANRSDEPVRFLNLGVPGGFETYMREFAEAMNAGQLERLPELFERFDIQVAPG
ncbi:MAG: hypothetical protein QOG62_2650 [Thermoleophilaceae bacterium]|jgi:quercetin dioxygenase-like cupin family protein|nr:hypothetical protein [Thermoleophilaceae bacterium]